MQDKTRHKWHTYAAITAGHYSKTQPPFLRPAFVLCHADSYLISYQLCILSAAPDCPYVRTLLKITSTLQLRILSLVALSYSIK